jgi:hypothetical protein
MDVDEEAIGPFLRFEQGSHRPPQGFVVARDHEHRDGFPIILGCPDDQMPQNAC